MTALSTIVGAALVGLALRDVFETLFHPHGRGVISERIAAGVWRLMRRAARRWRDLLSTAGPLSFLVVLASWILLVVFGFALILEPRMPEDFAFASSLEPDQRSGFLDATYLSLVNLTSLGYGDIVPSAETVRLLGPVETMIGLGLLTASISWLLSIYGVLAGVRSLAREVSLVAEVERSSGVALTATEPGHAAMRLADLATKAIAVRRDIRHFPIVYRFHSRAPGSDLSLAVTDLRRIALAGLDSDSPALAFEARKLDHAVVDLLDTVAEEFLAAQGEPPDRILELWRRDHLWDSAGAPG
jgi:hypothetical protein